MREWKVGLGPPILPRPVLIACMEMGSPCDKMFSFDMSVYYLYLEVAGLSCVGGIDSSCP